MTNLAVTSALGFLVAAPAIDYVRSYVSRLEQINWSHLNALFSDLQSEARTLLINAGAQPEEIPMMLAADIRHVGRYGTVTAGTRNKLHGKVIRFGTTGHVDESDIILDLLHLERTLDNCGWPVSCGAAVVAAEASFRCSVS